MATVNAASASRADVVTAIAAASNGDEVVIPAGTETWTSLIPLSKEIEIRGAGSGATVITDYGFDVADGTDNWWIRRIGFTNSTVAVGDPCFDVGLTDSADGCRNLQISECTFTGYGKVFDILGHCTGVIYDCTFTGGIVNGDFIVVWGDGDTAWTRDVKWGGSDFVFFEDCTWDNGGVDLTHFITVGRGGQCCIRYSTMAESSSVRCAGWIDIHGNGHGAGARGGRALECYELTLTRDATTFAWGFFLRGGGLTIHDITFDETTASFTDGGAQHIELTDYRASDPTKAGVSGTNTCAGTVDANLPTGEGYPACDQIGRGRDQTSDPAYFWNNENHLSVARNPGVDADVLTAGTPAEDFIVLNTDYYNSARPGYSPHPYPHPLRQGQRRLVGGVQG